MLNAFSHRVMNLPILPNTPPLCTTPLQAKAKLGWAPTTLFEELCKEMVEADIADQKAGGAGAKGD